MKQIFKLLTLVIAFFFTGCNKEENTNLKKEDINKAYEINQDEARKIALTLLTAGTNNSNDVQILTQSPLEAKLNKNLHVISAKKEGKDYFVIVSSDKRTEDLVLGFGENKLELNDAPEQFKFWLNNYNKLIADIKFKAKDDKEKLANYSNRINDLKSISIAINNNTNNYRYKNVSSYTYTNPFVTTTWNQGCVYNTYSPLANSTPSLSNCAKPLPCGKAYTGCVSTCLSQVVNYYKSMPVYNYTLLKNSYIETDANTPAGDEVGKLMKKVADIMRMSYSCTGSSSYASYYLPMYSTTSALGFTSYLKAYYFNKTSENLFTEIKNEIGTNNIVVFSGTDTVASAGHLWLADGGYFSNNTTDGTSYLHFNWGWGGKADGWFAYGDFNSGKYNFNSSTIAYYNFRK